MLKIRNTVKQMECCISNWNSSNHLATKKDVLKLKCGGYACIECIEIKDSKRKYCRYCKLEHNEEEMKKMPFVTDGVDVLMKDYIKNAVEIFNIEKRKMLEDFESIISTYENAIEIRVESIKMHLDDLCLQIEDVLDEYEYKKN
jgi:hypothetical protein